MELDSKLIIQIIVVICCLLAIRVAKKTFKVVLFLAASALVIYMIITMVL